MVPVVSHLRSPLPINDDVMRLVLCELKDGSTLMRLRRVCHQMKGVVDDFSKARYNVDKMLRLFLGMTNVLDFRCLQAEVGAVFSGSSVIQFFEDNDWADDSDLDVYLYAGTAGLVGTFLMARAGYVYQGDDFASDFATEPATLGKHLYCSPYVRRVYKFAKDDLKIDLVVATESPIRTIVHVHSRPIINGVTWNRAFSCFAAASWSKHGMVPTESSPGAIAKYRERGFKLYDGRASLKYEYNDYLRTGYRFIGDPSTWLIDLDTTGITAPTTSEILQNNSFTVTARSVLSGGGVLKTTAYDVEEVFFTHYRLAAGYTLADFTSRFAGMVIHCLSQRLSLTHTALDISIVIGENGVEKRITCWDKLLRVACAAWSTGSCLVVTVDGETAKFLPLGGTVLTKNFL
ncbi:hypothetical protein AURDEDRAFT_177997 [Auricularia subglabra TFB-10046 SS5]|uniref:Uncharacterized protein n=1 Tax=Auricularia subglabra (strain TFB-10046 / SS5) TaxID=717982 RepID=J0CRL7_AURST|nr:hypothetical protein AURDEDRAFT_177997 [Auricularia subglabra TFB-10046 SS5]